MTKLLIIGAGGHGRVIADCAHASGQFSDIAFLDDGFPAYQHNLHWPIIGKSTNWRDYLTSHAFALAIGNNKIRLSLFKELSQAKAKLPNIIHPSAIISPFATLGQGNVVFANSVINPAVTINNVCIINTAATIDHDCQLADAVHISPGVHLSGTVFVKELSWFGVGSCSVQSITIAQNTQIGAGAAVTKSTKANGLYVGVPAVRIKEIE